MESSASDTRASLVSARRIQASPTPTAPKLLWAIALLTAAAVIALSLQTIWVLRSAAHAYKVVGPWVDVLAALLAIASIAILRPLARGLSGCLGVRRANAVADLAAARLASKTARDDCWITLGYSMGQPILVIALQFLLANDRAVAKTFFLLPLIDEHLSAGAEGLLDATSRSSSSPRSLVLVWGLVVAVARLAPGAAGKPLRLHRHGLRRHVPRPAGDHRHLPGRLRLSADRRADPQGHVADDLLPSWR